jgi:tRNA pseudouridine synthase 9
VNGRVAAPGYALRDGDRVEHCLHRHEPPVPGQALRELRCAGAAPPLAICKPAGVPTHACGAHHQVADTDAAWQVVPHRPGVALDGLP